MAQPPALPTMSEVCHFARECTIDERISTLIPGFDAPFYQAGLAGYSDPAMRIVARKQGCPFCMTEALLDVLLLRAGKSADVADLNLIQENVPGSKGDTPLGGQVIGANPDEMAKAAAKLASFGYDLIDVNLACPVKKMGRKFRGGHFLWHPEEAIAVLKAVREAVPEHIPTTVKLRRGADDANPDSCMNFNRIFESVYELGYAWATVHGRTVTQKYQGPSNWDALRDLVNRYPDRIIMGSGDIWAVEDIFRMLKYTGVQAVSVARGCIGNPWIFRAARDLMEGKTPQPPTVQEQRDVLLEHFRLCCAVYGENIAGRSMRKFGIKFSHHHPQPEVVKGEFIKVQSLADWETVISRHYENNGGMDDASTR